MRFNNFDEFGPKFKYRLIKALIIDPSFYSQIHDALNPEFFDQKELVWIAKELEIYYQKYKKMPSFDDIELLAQDLSHDDKKIIKALINKIKATDDSHLELVKDKALAFCQLKALSHAIFKSAEILESSNDSIEIIKGNIDVEIKRAQVAGTESDIGTELFDTVDDVMDQSSRSEIGIATPWSSFNRVFTAWCPGELYVFVAPWKRGKSWILSKVGAGIADQDKRILHVTLELSEALTKQRYHIIYSGIHYTDFAIKKEETRIKLNQLYKVKNQDYAIKHRIRVKEYPTNGASANTLRGLIEKCKALDFDPHALVVDYGKLLKSSIKTDNSYAALGEVYTDLRAIAGEYKLPVITAMQTNKDVDERTIEKLEIIDPKNVAECGQILMIADIVFTFNRDISRKYGYIFIANSRCSSDGQILPVVLDYDYGKFEVIDMPSGKETLANCRKYFSELTQRTFQNSEYVTQDNGNGETTQVNTTLQRFFHGRNR